MGQLLFGLVLLLVGVFMRMGATARQYLEALHDMRGSNNLVIMVPTAGGLPMLNLGELRQNLRRP